MPGTSGGDGWTALEKGRAVSKGVAGSVLASVLFGALFYYVTLLDPLTGEEIFGWRMVLTAPCVTLFLLASRERGLIRQILTQLRRSPRVVPGVIACASLAGVQFWLFLWAPGAGRALEASLGYFLMPLMLVVVGRVFYGERLSRWRMVATIMATAGVINELIRVGSLSWVTLFVAIGYPIYFVLRRQLRTDHLGGAWLEMQLMVPAAAWFVLTGPTPLMALPEHPHLLALIPGLGVVSAMALSCYYIASRVLPFGLFGLLAYLEPALLVVVALLLGEEIAPRQWLTYVPIWSAVGVLVAEGVSRYVGRLRASAGALVPS
jgi:chloramphenicol-sensitive protein RarD